MSASIFIDLTEDSSAAPTQTLLALKETVLVKEEVSDLPTLAEVASDSDSAPVSTTTSSLVPLVDEGYDTEPMVDDSDSSHSDSSSHGSNSSHSSASSSGDDSVPDDMDREAADDHIDEFFGDAVDDDERSTRTDADRARLLKRIKDLEAELSVIRETTVKKQKVVLPAQADLCKFFQAIYSASEPLRVTDSNDDANANSVRDKLFEMSQQWLSQIKAAFPTYIPSIEKSSKQREIKRKSYLKKKKESTKSKKQSKKQATTTVEQQQTA
jgi:hypothetical protein